MTREWNPHGWPVCTVCKEVAVRPRRRWPTWVVFVTGLGVGFAIKSILVATAFAWG